MLISWPGVAGDLEAHDIEVFGGPYISYRMPPTTGGDELDEWHDLPIHKRLLVDGPFIVEFCEAGPADPHERILGRNAIIEENGLTFQGVKEHRVFIPTMNFPAHVFITPAHTGS